MEKVLVTGASGALAPAVIKCLRDQGYFVITSSRNEKNNCDIICDFRYKKQILNMLELSSPDIIVHLAVIFSGNFDEMYKVNVLSARYILEFLQNNKKKARVVLIGSASEYGLIKPEENPISENHVLVPVTSYAVSKAWQTQLMAMYAKGEIEVICARIFNLYGERVSEKTFAGSLQYQIESVLTGRQSKIIVGNLSGVRDYISTTEAAEQIANIISYGVHQNIYHVASGIPSVMRDFAMKQLQINGLEGAILEEKVFFNSSMIDLPVIFADVKKTMALTLSVPNCC